MANCRFHLAASWADPRLFSTCRSMAIAHRSRCTRVMQLNIPSRCRPPAAHKTDDCRSQALCRREGAQADRCAELLRIARGANLRTQQEMVSGVAATSRNAAEWRGERSSRPLPPVTVGALCGCGTQTTDQQFVCAQSAAECDTKAVGDGVYVKDAKGRLCRSGAGSACGCCRGARGNASLVTPPLAVLTPAHVWPCRPLHRRWSLLRPCCSV